MTMQFWLTWITTFFVVVTALMISVAAYEYWLWRKESK